MREEYFYLLEKAKKVGFTMCRAHLFAIYDKKWFIY